MGCKDCCQSAAVSQLAVQVSPIANKRGYEKVGEMFDCAQPKEQRKGYLRSSAPVPNRASRRRSGGEPWGAARAMDQKQGHASSHVPDKTQY